MAPDDEDALLRKVRAQHRSVSFITASELVNIDLEDESHRKEESELNETVRKLFYNELMMFSIFILSRMGIFCFQEILLAGILVNEARLGRNGYFQTSPKELRFSSFLKFIMRELISVDLYSLHISLACKSIA